MTAKYVEQLGLMLEFEQMVAARVGYPGCAARLKAADNVLALTWAIETLRPMVTPPPPGKCVEGDRCRCRPYDMAGCDSYREDRPLTMDDARRNAGFGNLADSPVIRTPVPRD
jgi:hypothetical protein